MKLEIIPATFCTICNMEVVSLENHENLHVIPTLFLQRLLENYKA